MSEKTEPVRTAAERVALYLKLYPYPSVGSEIVYDQRFKTEEWPRTGYPLLRADVQEILTDLASAEEMNTLQRKDMEEQQARVEDLEATETEMERRGRTITGLEGRIQTLTEEMAAEKARQDAYEENIVGDMNERAINDARKIAELETNVKQLTDMIASMRVNGARHHFVFAYDKHVESAGKRLQFCGECDKEKGHPAHFAQESRYLDSREVEKAAKAAQERLCNILEDGMKLNSRTALNTARELLQGLPGVGDFQRVPDRPEVKQATKGINTNPRMCNAGCGFNEDNHDDVTTPFPHDFSWGTVPRPKRFS
jgi:hypothetical protein